MNFRPEMEIACTAAQKAGEAIFDLYTTDYKSWEKPDTSPVTEADMAAESIILKILQQNSPYRILSEETKDTPERLSSEYIWVVDPLDGTKDFLHQTGDFSVMIGLVHHKRPVLGVVYKPTSRELYFAEKSKGCFYQVAQNNPRQLHVSTLAQTSDMKLTTSRMHPEPNDRALAEFLGVAHFQECGSVGVKIGLIARQLCDLYFNSTPFTSEWDTCAPDIILHEAGGKFTDLRGQLLQYNQPNVKRTHGLLGSNGIAHTQIVEKIQNFQSLKNNLL